MKKRNSVILVLALVFIMSAVFWSPKSATTSAKQTLTAAKVSKAPTGLDDPVWQKAKALEVPFEGKEKFAGQKAVVSTKAVYTDEDIYFLFKWKDDTKSITKGAWKFDGEKWSHQSGNEDRISLLFEIDRIKNFATKGCAITCHVQPGGSAADGKFGTATAAEKGDLWHWKAARSDPYNRADDTYITVITEKKGGRKSDAGKGGDKKNRTEDGSKPAFTLLSGRTLTDDGVLLAENAVAITDYSVFKSGDVLTDRMPVKPGGSRGDILAQSRHAADGWTVILSRKLDTGHDDDTAFNPRKKYSFAMALFDNSGDEDSYDSEVMTLQFGR